MINKGRVWFEERPAKPRNVAKVKQYAMTKMIPLEIRKLYEQEKERKIATKKPKTKNQKPKAIITPVDSSLPKETKGCRLQPIEIQQNHLT